MPVQCFRFLKGVILAFAIWHVWSTRKKKSKHIASNMCSNQWLLLRSFKFPSSHFFYYILEKYGIIKQIFLRYTDFPIIGKLESYSKSRMEMEMEMGGRFKREGLYVYLCRFMLSLTENNKILWSIYPSIKK